VHRWLPGDVVVWDNRATLHKRVPFDPDSRRVLYAAQVEGTGRLRRPMR
jgi:taurine dioxygenase